MARTTSSWTWCDTLSVDAPFAPLSSLLRSIACAASVPFLTHICLYNTDLAALRPAAEVNRCALRSVQVGTRGGNTLVLRHDLTLDDSTNISNLTEPGGPFAGRKPKEQCAPPFCLFFFFFFFDVRSCMRRGVAGRKPTDRAARAAPSGAGR